MKVVYELKNIGRGKWCGEVVCQSDAQERVEAALIAAVSKHLMSHEIDISGDAESGHIVVGGFRPVGEYKRKEVQP